MFKISVIIPSYNRATLIRRALDSVFNQSRSADEVIVVDDGSTDATADIISKNYPGVQLLRQPHGGVSRARNAGIQNSQGEWIALLDSDDAWQPDKLQRQVDYLQTHPDCRLVHTNEIWIRNGRYLNQQKKHRKAGGTIFQNCLPLCCISPSSAVIHRSLFDEIGLFDETLPACEDYDLWLRICARRSVGFIDEPLITKYGGHADQLSRQHWGMDRFRIKALTKILDSNRLPPRDRDAALAMLVEKLEIVLQGARKHDNQPLIEEYRLLLDRYTSVNHAQPGTALPRHA